MYNNTESKITEEFIINEALKAMSKGLANEDIVNEVVQTIISNYGYEEVARFINRLNK